MNDVDWLVCTEPGPMVAFLCRRGWGSDRKLRLFACACARHIWRLLRTDATRRAVEASEGYADGLVSKKALAQARLAAQDGSKGSRTLADWQRADPAGWTAWCAARESMGSAAVDTAHMASCAATMGMGGASDGATRAELADLLRDVVGDPFRPVSFDPAWARAGDGTAARLALACYEERDFTRLPILADALEEAGCADPAVLGHCRGPGPHVRGCWVIDLVLGRS